MATFRGDRIEVKDMEYLVEGTGWRETLLTLKDGTQIRTETRTVKSWTSVIADELKPLFGVRRIGLSYFERRGYRYVACRPYQANYPMPGLDYDDDDFKECVRRLLLFRYILGISTSTSDMSMRIIDDEERLVSFEEEYQEPVTMRGFDSFLRKRPLVNILVSSMDDVGCDTFTDFLGKIYEGIDNLISRIKGAEGYNLRNRIVTRLTGLSGQLPDDRM